MADPNSARHRAQSSRIKIISLSLSFLLGKRTRAVSPALLSLLCSHTAPTPKSRHHPFRQLTVSLRRDCQHQHCQSETAEIVSHDFPVLHAARIVALLLSTVQGQNDMNGRAMTRLRTHTVLNECARCLPKTVISFPKLRFSEQLPQDGFHFP